MRLFFDANVIFTAAHNPQGKASLVVELGRAGLWQMATSAYACEEARRNIERKYPLSLDAFELIAKSLHIVPEAPAVNCPDGLVEKDCPIFRAALGCRADVLLTGDVRDFGFLMNAPEKAGGVLIQTVAQFLDSAALGQ